MKKFAHCDVPPTAVIPCKHQDAKRLERCRRQRVVRDTESRFLSASVATEAGFRVALLRHCLRNGSGLHGMTGVVGLSKEEFQNVAP